MRPPTGINRFRWAIVWSACFLGLTCLGADSLDSPRFAIHLVRTPSPDVSKAVLEKEPLITDADLVSYRWPTHVLEFTEAGRKKLPSAESVGVHGREFVIVADGERCYQGAFWSAYSSRSYGRPIIEVLLPQRTLSIQRAYAYPDSQLGEDPRLDERIRRVLQAVGKLETLEH